MKKLEERYGVGYVVWEDANGDTSTQHEVRHAPVPLLTAGLIVKSDQRGVTVAQDFAADGGFRDVKFIPRANVLEEKVLKAGVVSRSPQVVTLPAPPERKKKK